MYVIFVRKSWMRCIIAEILSTESQLQGQEILDVATQDGLSQHVDLDEAHQDRVLVCVLLIIMLIILNGHRHFTLQRYIYNNEGQFTRQ